MPLPETPSIWLRYRLVLVGVAAGVVMLHGALWQGVSDARAAPVGTPASLPAVQVRTVETRAPAPAAVIAPLPATAPATQPRAVSSAVTKALTQALPAPVVAPPMAVLVAAALPDPALAAAEPAPLAEVADREDLPIYRTDIPPSITLHYEMRRGMLSGTGALQWRHSGNAYEARLDGRVAGINILTWASQGSFDKAGIAPVRYTDSRRGKNEQAANFQRKAGKISYSGPSTEYPLLDGTQDRLSWMIQAAAIARANPKLMAVGTRIAMFVTGARGDAEVWAFQVQGIEDVDAGGTARHAIKLMREPRRPHDTRVEVWLDPAEHHLPVRARLSTDGDALELLLQSTQPS